MTRDQFDRDFDRFDRDFRRLTAGIIAVWVIGFALSAAAVVAVIWAVVALVGWVTAQ